MVGRRDALYRIMATTDGAGPGEHWQSQEWASHDSLTITDLGGTRESQAPEPGTMLQMGIDWPVPFRNRVRGGGLLEKNRNSKI